MIQYLFEVVHFQGQLLQCEQDELQQGGVVGGFGVGEPGVEQPVATNSDKPGWKKEQLIYDGGGLQWRTVVVTDYSYLTNQYR